MASFDLTLEEPIYYSSATALAGALAAGDLSSRELTEVVLARIEQVNGALNAVVALDAQSALERADEADRARARGQSLGPLHGIPMTIKDSFDTAGLVSTGGTKGRRNFVPDRDATVVARLKKAGAHVIGKTNTPQFTSSFETDNDVYGQTKNPYDLARSPGGSSGGAAAILAAGGSPLEIGSDFGGSIRLPSAFCGTAGIKPTMGRVPRTGHIFPFGGVTDSMQQIGPMARRVEDLILALPLMVGPDGIDPAIVPMPLGDPNAVGVGDLNVAFYAGAAFAEPMDAIQQTVREAARAIAVTGAKVDEVEAASFTEAFTAGIGLFGADGGAGFARLLKEAGTTTTRPLENAREGLSAVELDELLNRWYGVRSQIATAYLGFDVILSPANARTAPPIGWANEEGSIQAFSYTILHNVSGWPSGVVRCGTDPDGLPIAVQITAHPSREDLVLAVALELERQFGGFQRPAERAW